MLLDHWWTARYLGVFAQRLACKIFQKVTPAKIRQPGCSNVRGSMRGLAGLPADAPVFGSGAAQVWNHLHPPPCTNDSGRDHSAVQGTVASI